MHRTRFVFSLLLATILSAIIASPAFASLDVQAACEIDGASWVGTSIDTGTCYWGPHTVLFQQACVDEDLYDYYGATYVDGNYVNGSGGCHLIASGSDSNEGTTTDSHNQNGTNGNNEGSTLTLGEGKNGWVNFPAGACPQRCTISSTLPNAADNALPGGALATVYVRVVAEDGTTYDGSYTVCFANPDGDTLTIYRYIGGVWTAVQVAATDPICVTASGDGAFYLGY